MDMTDFWKEKGDVGNSIKNIMSGCIFETFDDNSWILCTEDALKAAYNKIDQEDD
jgi:hypothetical protein